MDMHEDDMGCFYASSVGESLNGLDLEHRLLFDLILGLDLVLGYISPHLLSMLLQPDAPSHKRRILMQPPDDFAQMRFIVPVDDSMTDEEIDDEQYGPVRPLRRVGLDLGEDLRGGDELRRIVVKN